MRDYEVTWNFPNCCGAMDGKHVIIKCPANSSADYFNYKKSFSIILFAVVDANYNFLFIDVGTNGRANDAHVFSKSAFNVALERSSLDVPEQGVFVADDAFPLRTYILKPFSRCGSLNETQRIFNYRLSRARRVVENTFGILAARFRIFERPIPIALSSAEQLVKTACALHNWLRKTSTPADPYIQAEMLSVEDWTRGRVNPGTVADSPRCGLRDLPRRSSTNHPRAAAAVRQNYAESFMTTNSVPWQWSMI